MIEQLVAAELDEILGAKRYERDNEGARMRTLTTSLGPTPIEVPRELKQAFDAWRTQRLDDKRIVYLLLDAIMVKVRTDRRVQTMPVVVALGVHDTGEKELLRLMMMASESGAPWRAMVEDLSARGLKAPILCIIDGNPGLRHALAWTWPEAKVQRCVVRQLRNLQAHCPKKALDDLRRDYHNIVEAKSEKAARAAFDFFVRTWRSRCAGVVNSLLEAGDELLTHYQFPSSRWKCLRTTNAIERLQEEFRRRVKAQSSFPTESSVLHLVFAIYASWQIRMRRIDGWKQIPDVIKKRKPDLLNQAA